MKRLIAVALLAIMFAAATWAAAAGAASAGLSPADAVRQVGQDMGDAMIAQDIEKLDRIFGDDWMTLGLAGGVYTKQTLLRDIKAGNKRLTWFELGPIDVQIFGDVAIAQGYVAEKRTIDGKDTHLELVYADILKKRDGRWVVVRSMGTKVK